MPGLGATNVSYSGIFGETSASTTNTFYQYNNSSWAEGPFPGNSTYTFWGAGTQQGVASNDILYNPSANGAGIGVTSDFKFGFFQNYMGYMDQSFYKVLLYIENQIAPATRPDPTNDVNVDCQIFDKNLVSGSICGIGGNAFEGGGTFGPTDVSSPSTFNVNYFYVSGYYACTGLAGYNVEIRPNGVIMDYYATIGGSAGPVAFDFSQFLSGTPTNTGGGFTIDFLFT